MSNDKSMLIRLPSDLHKAFEAAVASNDLTMAQVIRSMIREYVKANQQAAINQDKV